LANNRGFISLEWDGLAELEALLDGMEERIERIAKEEYTDFGFLVEEAVKALMPRDEGDLESSYNIAPARREGDEIVVEGGSNSEYAVRRHEEPYRMGVYPKYDNGAKFPGYYVNGRGARTRNKPGFRGEKAGRKFQERAVNLLKPDFEKMNKRILERVLGGE
jgi:Bacteriophage HK97-gp10, putative tail-component